MEASVFGPSMKERSYRQEGREGGKEGTNKGTDRLGKFYSLPINPFISFINLSYMMGKYFSSDIIINGLNVNYLQYAHHCCIHSNCNTVSRVHVYIHLISFS